MPGSELRYSCLQVNIKPSEQALSEDDKILYREEKLKEALTAEKSLHFRLDIKPAEQKITWKWIVDSQNSKVAYDAISCHSKTTAHENIIFEYKTANNQEVIISGFLDPVSGEKISFDRQIIIHLPEHEQRAKKRIGEMKAEITARLQQVMKKALIPHVTQLKIGEQVPASIWEAIKDNVAEIMRSEFAEFVNAEQGEQNFRKAFLEDVIAIGEFFIIDAELLAEINAIASKTNEEVEIKSAAPTETSKVLKTIEAEIKRVDFHPGWFAKHLHPKSENNRLQLEKDKPEAKPAKHITTTTKAVYDLLQENSPSQLENASAAPQQITESEKLNNAANTFRQSITSRRQNLAFFSRSDVSKIFYETFANPTSAHYAKETLTQIVKSIYETPDNDWRLNLKNRFHGEKKTYFINDKDGVPQAHTKRFPKHAAQIIDLYNAAYNYENLTWQNAVLEAERILCRVYSPIAARPVFRSEATQTKYNEALMLIQTQYHDTLKLNNKNFKAITADQTVFNQILDDCKANWIDIKTKATFQTNWTDIKTKATNELKKIMDVDLPSPADKLLALQYLTSKLFEIAQEIPFGKRNGSKLYKALMRKIATLNTINVEQMSDRQVRKLVEPSMCKNKKVYATRASIFLDKYPALKKNQQPSKLKLTNQ